MKAVILAAGQGTRTLPLTENLPKPLIPINGKPFLYYLLKNLQHAGCDDIGIVVGYKNESIIDFLKQHQFRATVIVQPKPSGTGNATKMARPFTKNEPFLLVHGDGLWSVRDIETVLHASQCTLGIQTVPQPEQYGVCLLNNEKLVGIIEKPTKPIGIFVNTGLMKLTPDIYPALDSIAPSATGEYHLTDALTSLAQQHKVNVARLQDPWLDLGKPEDISVVEKKISDIFFE